MGFLCFEVCWFFFLFSFCYLCGFFVVLGCFGLFFFCSWGFFLFYLDYYYFTKNKIIIVFLGECEILFSFVFLWLRKRLPFWFSRNCRFHVLLVLMLKGVKQGRAQLYYFSGSWVATSVLPVLINGIADIHREVLAEYWREKSQRWWLCRSKWELWAEMLFIE